MRIAVTGASGFIGQVLLDRARAAGVDAVPVSRGDVRFDDPVNLARSFEGADAVVHLAARAHQSGSDRDFECNVELARSVARAASTADVRRLVLLSSIGVNGNITRDHPFTEADSPAPVEAYARSKWRAEQVVQEVLHGSPTDWVILRPPLVYGPRAPGNFARLVKAVRKGWPLPLASIDNRRTLVDVGDLCHCILLACTHERASRELFLVGNSPDCSTPQIIESIAQGLSRAARLWHCPPPLLRAGATMLGRGRLAQSLCDSLQVDAGKARRVLGWAPATSTLDGIEQAAAAWRDTP